jgi:hypothetical protein
VQNFDRNAVEAPPSLSDGRSELARQALLDIFGSDPSRIEQTRVRMSQYAVKEQDIEEALHRLFHNRCSFCEAEVPVSPYRFRPPEEAGPTSSVAPEFADFSHLYYTWLVNDWANIYAICEECRPIEQSIFPIRSGRRMPLPKREQITAHVGSPSGRWPYPASEMQLFLDPCGDENFRRNLAAAPDGQLFGLTDRGDATVKQFNLNRDSLIHRRREAFAKYFSDMFGMGEPGYGGIGPFRFSEMEFGGSWFLLLYQLARRIGSGSRTSPRLTPGTMRDYFAQRIESANFEKQLRDAWNSFDSEALRRPGRRRRVVMRGRARPISFRIQGFKSVEDLSLDMMDRSEPIQNEVGIASIVEETARRTGSESASPALMILGENAVGKSSILEAIALLLAGGAARSVMDLPVTSFMLDPDLLGGKGRLRTSGISAVFEDKRRLSIEITAGGVRGDEDDDEDRIPVFAYGAFRMFADPDTRQDPSSAVVSIFRPDHVLPNPEKWLVKISDTPLFSEVRRALNCILAIDQEYDGIHVVGKRCFLVTTVIAPNGQQVETKTPLGFVSSGFRSVLSMACHVIRGLAEAQDASSASLANERAVVLIDEVEAHLHPRWKMRVVRGLREALPGVTFIMTTHDPLCLRGLSAGELVVLRRVLRTDPRATIPSTIEQLENLPAVSALTVEQLLTSDFFDLFSTDEGATEITLARAGDLLASEAHGLQTSAGGLTDLRRSIGEQIARALPIGSTEIERLVQEAVEEFLRKRSAAPASERLALRETTRNLIVEILSRY